MKDLIVFLPLWLALLFAAAIISPSIKMYNPFKWHTFYVPGEDLYFVSKLTLWGYLYSTDTCIISSSPYMFSAKYKAEQCRHILSNTTIRVS